MANTDSVSVRVFSLNCWSVTVDCRVSGCTFYVLMHVRKHLQAQTVHILCFFSLRGIRYLSKHLPQRYAMIGNMLCKEEHDIVLLQEVGGSCLIVLESCRVTALINFSANVFYHIWAILQ